MIRNGINFMLKPPKNLKCPICGKKCYLHEKTSNYACIDSNCDFAVGSKEYYLKLFRRCINDKKCDFSATTFKGKWFIMYNKEPPARTAFG